MKKRAVAAMAVWMAGGLSGAAQAEGRLYPAFSVATEYRFDGVSSSSGAPVVQAGLHWWRPDKFFAGVYATTVDYSGFYDETTSYEVDFYAGRNWDFGGPDFYAGAHTRLSLQGMYVIFPDNETPGPTYDFLQAKARLQHRVGKWRVEASTSFTPQASYGAGRAWLARAGAAHEPTSWLALDGNVGVRHAENRADRTFWDMGATATIGQVALDLRYYDTDLSYVECGYSANCDSALVGKLTWNLPSIAF